MISKKKQLNMRVLINNREDFNNWCECNDSFNRISYEEDKPKYYPCIISFRVVDSYDSIYDNLYYEFVYLQDFSELNEDNDFLLAEMTFNFLATINNTLNKDMELKKDSERSEPETISEIVPHPEKFNPKTQPCVLTNHGIVTDIIKFD